MRMTERRKGSGERKKERKRERWHGRDDECSLLTCATFCSFLTRTCQTRRSSTACLQNQAPATRPRRGFLGESDMEISNEAMARIRRIVSANDEERIVFESTQAKVTA